MSDFHTLVENLNHHDRSVRLKALQNLIHKRKRGNEVNNHIHTFYSFSPYSPAKAVWLSAHAGLSTAGIMDHDSISGAEEFIEAGKIIGLATTIGLECRTDFSKTSLMGRRINHPDQKSLAYIALHGIPHTRIQAVAEYFAPYIVERNKRNRQMTERLNCIFKPYGVQLDFDKDVIPLSKYNEGGSITERHLLFALANKLMALIGRGEKLVSFLEKKLHLKLKPGVKGFLKDLSNEYYAYDLLGVLKSGFMEDFYIEAEAECPDIRETLEFFRKIGAISAYAYLGDITDSVTGDKKSQKFEDEYLYLLFETIKDLGFQAVTYMPTRNSPDQLKRVIRLCEKYNFFQISGEDINSPRQSFTCKALELPEFKHLIDSTWALIGHERSATRNMEEGMFSESTVSKYPDLGQRIQKFKEIGRRS